MIDHSVAHTSFAVAVCTVLVLGAAGSGSARADDSLAGLVPADVGLFVEARNADDLLIPLTDPQVWLTLAGLAGQPAQLQDAEEWRRRIRQTVRMDPVEAIRVLFSQRVAFVGEGAGRAQDAVVLCRPVADVAVAELLERWSARPVTSAGRKDVYTLRNNIGLGVRDGVLVFGDATPTDGMFARTTRLGPANGAESLASDPAYHALLARVPADPDGILFARLGKASPVFAAASQPASQPVSQPSAREALGPAIPELPGPLRGASNVLLALHRDGSLLHFTAVGDARVAAQSDQTELIRLVGNLPERTLVAWGGRVDFAALLRAVQSLPERNVLRLATRLQDRTGNVQRLLATLYPRVCVAVGVVTPTGRTVAAPPLPAVGVLVTAREPEVAAAEFGALVESTVSLYDLLSLARGLPRLAPLADVDMAGTTARLLDLSQVLEGWDGGAIGALHVCWAIDGDELIVASHRDWLRQILEARRGRGTNLTRVLRLTVRTVLPGSESIIVAQPGPIADLGSLWLKYLEAAAPHALHEAWWRDKQPGGGRVRLGLDAVPDAERRRLRVTHVDPNMPAAGIVRTGDELLGLRTRRLATTQPAAEIQQVIMERPNADWVDLVLERDGAVLVKRVPIPFFNPVRTLRHALALGTITQRVVYHDDVPDAAGPRGFLTVELRTSTRPLFDFASSPEPLPVGPTDGE